MRLWHVLAVAVLLFLGNLSLKEGLNSKKIAQTAHPASPTPLQTSTAQAARDTPIVDLEQDRFKREGWVEVQRGAQDTPQEEAVALSDEFIQKGGEALRLQIASGVLGEQHLEQLKKIVLSSQSAELQHLALQAFLRIPTERSGAVLVSVLKEQLNQDESAAIQTLRVLSGLPIPRSSYGFLRNLAQNHSNEEVRTLVETRLEAWERAAGRGHPGRSILDRRVAHRHGE